MGMIAHRTKSAEIRAGLDHPIVDADGHLSEFSPRFIECVHEVGGVDFANRFLARMAESNVRGSDWSGWEGQSWEQRRDRRTRRSPWWGSPTKNTLDAATAALPNLLRERMDEMGIDYVISYGGLSLYLPLENDEEIRRITLRALNTAQADVYREHADRITPVAAIPMHTPQEAIDELEHAVNVLGHKVIMIAPGVPRPIPSIHREHPDVFPDACWVDNYALDSEYDYDPFWSKCVELHVAVTVHAGILPVVPWYGRSISSFVYNHLGNHAYSLGLLCKALFLGGVTRRFPGLNIAFLEGGIGWAIIMFAEIIGTWEKRNLDALELTNPANMDRQQYLDLTARYGGPMVQGKQAMIERNLDQLIQAPPPELRDEWAALEISKKDDLRDLFVPNFYFGCEADDPINSWAFNTKTNPFGARLNAVMGSDIGHYDVPDMTKVVEEVYALVEDGVISEQDFKDLVFGNAVRLHGGMNPDFFKGTAIESDAANILADTKTGGGSCPV
ncbi:MAG: amidohydrolase family protein [Chloroflexi bacterium]|nr:amidohydrolase family protein [Chloroflexota bacterium]